MRAVALQVLPTGSGITFCRGLSRQPQVYA